MANVDVHELAAAIRKRRAWLNQVFNFEIGKLRRRYGDRTIDKALALSAQQPQPRDSAVEWASSNTALIRGSTIVEAPSNPSISRRVTVAPPAAVREPEAPSTPTCGFDRNGYMRDYMKTYRKRKKANQAA